MVLVQNTWKANCQIAGPVTSWLAELSSFVDLRDIQAAGELGMTCNATFDSEKIELNNINYRIDDLFFNGFGNVTRLWCCDVVKFLSLAVVT